MAERTDELRSDDDLPFDSNGDDDRVGEAVEAFLALAEQGQAPQIDEFVARYPELKDDVRAALDGLELVHGLLGLGSASGSGLGRGRGVDHRIELGHRIAGYRVVRELGRGGMGTVYEAVHVGLDRPVALKVLGMHAAPDSSARRRFLNEARTAAGLHHTHIVPVFDVGQVGGLCYYAMQRIEGSGLDRVVRHLRHSRPANGGGGGPAGGRFATQDAQGNAGASSINSRLGNLWIRVSSGWLRRQHPHTGPGNGGIAARTVPAKALASQHGVITGDFGRSGLGDSTASWATSSRQASLHEARAGDDASSSAIVTDSQAVLSTIDPLARRRDDELPRFEPPRGSAYFRWVAEIGLQSADALAHAHHQGVIHRDVKPSNLLIDDKGNIWVTDFGLARRLADPGLTHHDSLLGTPRYMSPEQARTGAIDGRTDVYSLGATLYELLALRPPFDGRSAAELIEQIGQDEPTPPSAVDPRVPRDLETIVLKSLAKRPADRYATAAELAEDLARFLNHEPVRARRISAAGRLWRVARRHPGITAVTTAAAATILAIATYAYVRILAERDKAVRARDETQQALHQTEEANRKSRAEVKERLLKTVELVGLSGTPNRRSQGLDLIEQAVAQGPESTLVPKLRDEAVKFLVLREVQPLDRELPTGRTHGLVFGPAGHRLAVLSEDDEELSFWDIGRHQRQSTLNLRLGPAGGQATADSSSGEGAGGDRSDNGPINLTGSSANRNAVAPAIATTGGRRAGNWLVNPRVAQIGQALAALLPDDRGLALFDLLAPGAPPRILSPSDHTVLSVIGDPAGRRLVTVEQELEDPLATLDGLPAECLVNLWDPDHLDRPVAKLNWTRPMPPGRMAPFPLVTISPDGKTVAVAANRSKYVRLFSAIDGEPIVRNGGRNDGRPRGRPEGKYDDRNDIDTQTELSALTLGSNDSLATAGTTAGGGVIKIWNLVDPRTMPTSLMPLNQNGTRLVRFNSRGTLLAILGVGPIELWDPLAHALVAVLRMNDQAIDLAFAPDGRTLAAAGRSSATAVWTVQDSAVRTQLSGFESTPSSLAFSSDGVLAGAGWARGDIWYWRSGRCPELGAPLPQISTPAVASSARITDSKRPEPRDRDDTRKGERDRPRDGNRSMMRPPTPTVLAFDADDRLVAHDGQGLRIWSHSNPAQTSPNLKQALPRVTGNGPWRITLLAKTGDGRTMALARSSTVYLWNAESADQVIQVTPPSGWVAESGSIATKAARPVAAPNAEAILPQIRTIQVAPQGSRVYLLEQNQAQGTAFHVWDIDRPLPGGTAQAHELKWTLPLGDGLISIALRGDGALLAVGNRSGTVALIDTRARKIVGTIPPQNEDSENNWLAMAFSPDGQSLAIGSPEGTISFWSVNKPTRPRLRFHLPGHRGAVIQLAFDAQNRRLASAGLDPLVEVWDLELIQRELVRLKLAD